MKISKEEAGFIIKFSAIFALSEFILVYGDFTALQNIITAGVSNYFALEYAQNLIFVPGGTFAIVSSCTGLVSIAVLAAIVFSLKKPELWQKAAIFIVGASLLFALNYVRLFLVIWAGKEYGLLAGEIVHIISWFTTAAFVIGLWYYLTRRLTGAKSFSGFL